tara:strand:- start:468 stop:710 length:243 start_codon:yes stop_codon:yes gene_type:complete
MSALIMVDTDLACYVREWGWGGKVSPGVEGNRQLFGIRGSAEIPKPPVPYFAHGAAFAGVNNLCVTHEPTNVMRSEELAK